MEENPQMVLEPYPMSPNPDNSWKYILEQAKLAHETWYIEPELAEPAKDSLSNPNDGGC